MNYLSPEEQLFAAAEDGNMEVVESLLEAQVVDIHQRVHGLTPFLIAFMNGHYNIARRLALAGAEVNEPNPETRENPFLNLMVRNKPANVLRHYLEIPGVNPNITDRRGYSPLIVAAQNLDLEKVLLLLAAGADPNKRTTRGTTALYESVLNSEYDMFMALLNAGADPNIPGHSNTPVILSALFDVEEGDLRFAEELMRRGARLSSPEFESPVLHEIIHLGVELALIQFAIHHGANINEADNSGHVPLEIAIEEGDEEIFTFLLRSGAKVTPAVRAAAAEKENFARILADFERLEEAIYIEPLPMGTRANNIWARQNSGENVDAIIANLGARRAVIGGRRRTTRSMRKKTRKTRRRQQRRRHV